MSVGGNEGAGVEFDTARGRDWPSVRQFNIFVENRLGGLLNVVRRFETHDNRIVSLTVVDSADCAIIRMVMTDPERAYEVLEQAGLPFTESNLLVVQLPQDAQPLLALFKTLLMAEINIHYAYPLLLDPQRSPAIALYVEDIETATATLQQHGFVLLTENDLKENGA